MTARIIDGREISRAIREELRAEVARLRERGVLPALAVVLMGDNPASVSYVTSKTQACADIGVETETFRLPAEVPAAEVVALIDRLNRDPRWHGILIQKPYPPQISESILDLAVDPTKDVDGQSPVNLGRLFRGEPTFPPATPAGVVELLRRIGESPEGRHVVICGRSNLVGKPLAGLLMQKAPGANATVTVCHTGTRDLAHFTRQADIIVAAMGRARAITADMVREGAVVIDVGNNPVPDPSRKSGYRLVGDVDFDAVAQKASWITPVPGGVGPMTVTMLLVNTVRAAKGGPAAE